jgi:hypothetical protein
LQNDDLIARLQRTAVISCGVMAAASLAMTRSWPAGGAVLGGGLLIGVSFLSIRGAVEGRSPVAFSLLKLVGRYALLAFLAYVMIARLRLPPLGLLAGASSIAIAAALEAAGLLRKKQ